MKQPVVLFYISSHGLGHASRVAEIINAFAERNPNAKIIIRTKAAQWFFNFTIKHAFEYYPVALDFGAVQDDYFAIDVLATLEKFKQLLSKKKDIIQEEVDFIKKLNVSIIFADIPPFAFDVASAVGIQAIAHSNFSWDWIYTPYIKQYPQFSDLIEEIRLSYRQAEVLLRLPMHGDMSVFPSIIDIPFVARRSDREPAEIIKAIGLPTDKKLIFVSFGGIGISLDNLKPLKRLKDYTFITTQPMEMDPEVVRQISNEELTKNNIRFEDLVHASDVILSKPSYGIISECIANRTRFMYSERADFIESEVLIEGVKKYLPYVEITREDLFTGNWELYLEKVLGLSFNKELPQTNGAEVAAGIIEKYLS